MKKNDLGPRIFFSPNIGKNLQWIVQPIQGIQRYEDNENYTPPILHLIWQDSIWGEDPEFKCLKLKGKDWWWWEQPKNGLLERL